MKSRFRPSVESLDGRTLPSAGVTAVLSKGTLTIQRTSDTAPLTIEVLTRPAAHKQVQGQVVVVGVAKFSARKVNTIDVDPGSTSTGVTIKQSSTAPISVHLLEPTTFSPPAAPVASIPTAAPSPTPSTTQVLSPDENGVITAMGQQIVDMTNAQRALVGLPALTIDPRLVLAAQIHAHDMATLDDMAHTLAGVPLSTLQDRANFVDYHYAWLGENIAEGFGDATSVMNGWMNSPGHKANILETNFTDIGVGICADANGTLFFDVDFGSRQS